MMELAPPQAKISGAVGVLESGVSALRCWIPLFVVITTEQVIPNHPLIEAQSDDGHFYAD